MVTMEWQQQIDTLLLPDFEKTSIKSALYMLFKRERYLLSTEAHEQAVTHRLAVYLEGFYPEYHVDCEYNRDGSNSKRVDENLRRPDIIIHKRGPLGPNLMVLEIKLLKTDQYEIEADYEKLKRIKQKFSYSFALSLTLGLVNEAPTAKIKQV